MKARNSNVHNFFIEKLRPKTNLRKYSCPVRVTQLSSLLDLAVSTLSLNTFKNTLD